MGYHVPVRDARPQALARSGLSVGLPRLLAVLLPMAVAMYGTFQGAQLVLLPAQLEQIDPERKIFDLAAIVMLCAVTGVVGMTAGGALSDLTRSRYGKRAPWLVGMGALSSLLLIAIGHRGDLITIAALCGAFWFTMNFFQGALLAITPDRVPEGRRALASSIFAVAGPIGSLYGMNLAALAPGARGYTALGVMVTLTTLLYVAMAPEAPALRPRRRMESDEDRPRGLAAAARFFEGFASRDFVLAYMFRVLMFAGQSTIFNYLLYILQDHVGLAAIPGHSAEIAAGDLSTLRTVATLVAVGGGVWLANRTTRRKRFVVVYALGMAAAMMAPVLWPTWNGMLVFAALGGLSIGAYSTIDIALMSQVLPSKKNTGRDLALLAMAGAAAQLIAPPLGGVLIRYAGYDWLFIAAAAVTLVAGGVTLFIRGVR
ncbi:MAG TPA: MFS transporter [Roseiarcus sp.]|nr:MFS transporter [Roseiarcus sp.]